MLITKFIEIDLGHRVTNHKSKCKNLHGHRYKIVAGVDDKVIITKGASDEGMVIDFSDLKEVMMQEIDERLDHGFLLYDQDPFKMFFDTMIVNQPGMKVIYVPFVPTAENIAKWLFGIVKQKLAERNIFLRYIEVYETPTSTAMYTAENWVEDMK